jgi:cellulose synthase/poly-beta-1,6-N-acetylglucosamine synthase-like glycosyltransferase
MFSVLISIYYKEKPQYFNRAMKSIWDEQTIKPNEIILVLDGSLTNELYSAIDQWQDKIGELFKTIPLDKNVGLGNALNIGMNHCSYELIARMDTDDISAHNRFERQLNVFRENDVDVCSAFISEFDNDENLIVSHRVVPELHYDIIKYSKFRNPLNHAVAMYKKSVVENSGGYKHMLWMEDYYLWVRMIMNGAKLYNIQDTLLNVRAGSDMLQRRGGLSYVKSELDFLNEIKKIGYITTLEYKINILLKVPTRLLPKFILKYFYRLLRIYN